MSEEKVKLEDLIGAPFTTEHRSAAEAVLADLADIVPVVGEIGGTIRIVESVEREKNVRTALEAGDLLAGFPPGIGDLLDILTPTNLLLYLREKRRE